MSFIQNRYPGSTQVALIGLERVNERVIRHYAIDNGYISTTLDAEFYEMSLIHGQPPKKVYFLAFNHVSRSISACLNNLN